MTTQDGGRSVRRFADEFGPQTPAERYQPRSRPMPSHGSPASPPVPVTAAPESDDDYEWHAAPPSTDTSPAAVAAAHGRAEHALPDRARVVFSRPYESQGEPVHAIDLRKPVTKDIRRFGSVLKRVFGAKGEIVDIEYNWEAVAQYASALSSPMLVPSTVDRLEFDDLEKVAEALAPFFATWMRPPAS